MFPSFGNSFFDNLDDILRAKTIYRNIILAYNVPFAYIIPRQVFCRGYPLQNRINMLLHYSTSKWEQTVYIYNFFYVIIKIEGIQFSRS